MILRQHLQNLVGLFFACRRLQALVFFPLAVFVCLLILCFKFEYRAERGPACFDGVLRFPADEVDAIMLVVSSSLEGSVFGTALLMSKGWNELWEVAAEL